MKIILFGYLACGLFLLPALSHAQGRSPQLGYWNLETNLTTRDYTIVRFYDGQDQLVYEERLAGLCLDLGRGRRRCRQATTRHLNVALQQVLRDATRPAPGRAARWWRSSSAPACAPGASTPCAELRPVAQLLDDKYFNYLSHNE